MKTIVVAAVNSKHSINLEMARTISYKGNFELLDLNDYKSEIPMLSNDELAKGIPDAIKTIYQTLTPAKNVILIAPEHNGGYSAFLKNVLDWLSRYHNTYFEAKNVVLVVTTPGAMGGVTLREFADKTLPYTGAASVKTFGFASHTPDKNFDSEIDTVINYLAKLK